MDPVRLAPEVELPYRRIRPFAFGLTAALLFSLGAMNYARSVRRHHVEGPAPVRLILRSEPMGASVYRGTLPVCTTPCTAFAPAIPTVQTFRFVMNGHESRTVPVNLLGGDTQIEAVLPPRY